MSGKKKKGGVFGMGCCGVITLFSILIFVTKCVHSCTGESRLSEEWTGEYNTSVSKGLKSKNATGVGYVEWKEYSTYYDVRHRSKTSDSWQYTKIYK